MQHRLKAQDEMHCIITGFCLWKFYYNVSFSFSSSLEHSGTARLKYNLCGLVGPLPMVSKGTHVIIPLVDNPEDKHWKGKIVEQNGNKIKLSISSPATAVCGLYGLTVTSSSSKDEPATTHDCSKNIVILFNPWCEGKTGMC